MEATNRTVRMIQRREVFNKFVFRIDELKFQHALFNGSMSEPITRLVLNRGDSVAVLVHETENHLLLLCEQFRMPTYERGPGWLLELPAGILEDGENEEDCARRETMEEMGYAVRALRRIGSVYLSPGGSSERVHIYYAEVMMSDRAGEAGGLISEGEDIRLVTIPVGDAIARARNGEILDAKTLIALQWLDLSNSGAGLGA